MDDNHFTKTTDQSGHDTGDDKGNMGEVRKGFHGSDHAFGGEEDGDAG